MDLIRSAGSVTAIFLVMFLGGAGLLRGAPVPPLDTLKLTGDHAQVQTPGLHSDSDAVRRAAAH